MEKFITKMIPALREKVQKIPKPFRNDETCRQVLLCLLFTLLETEGYQPVPFYRPPRRPQGQVALLGLEKDGRMALALTIDPLVTLEGVRSLEAAPAEKKICITFSEHEKKLKDSTFFLPPAIIHIHLGA